VLPLRASPIYAFHRLEETTIPGKKFTANVIDNMLHQNFLVRGAKQQLWMLCSFSFSAFRSGFDGSSISALDVFGAALLAPLVAVDYAAFSAVGGLISQFRDDPYRERCSCLSLFAH